MGDDCAPTRREVRHHIGLAITVQGLALLHLQACVAGTFVVMPRWKRRAWSATQHPMPQISESGCLPILSFGLRICHGRGERGCDRSHFIRFKRRLSKVIRLETYCSSIDLDTSTLRPCLSLDARNSIATTFGGQRV